MRALVVGHTGQDGTLLCEDLLRKVISILGISSSKVYSSEGTALSRPPNIQNYNEISEVIRTFRPAQIYYLPAHHYSSEAAATISFRSSFEQSEGTHVNGLLNCLSAIKAFNPGCKLFYASSSLIFDGTHGEVQDETTPFTPVGIYGITKAQGIWLCREFVAHYNVFASSGILYNHESHLRKPDYLTQKIVQAARRISSGSTEKLILGDLSSKIDWSYAPDFIDAFQRIMKLNEPSTYIVSSGEAHSVQEFLEIAFDELNLNWTQYVSENTTLLNRRTTVRIGNHTKLTEHTGWGKSFSFPDFVRRLVKDAKTQIAH